MPQPQGSPNGGIVETPALRFFERLASVQLVVGVTEHVSKCYCEVKARSAFLSAALTNAENAVVAVVQRCQREARARIDRRKLEFVDSLACRGLEELERRYPAALRRPEEIVAEVAAFARKKAEQAKGFAREKVVCALAVLPAALHIAPAEALAAGFHQVVLSGKRVVLVADGYLDDLVAAYNALHTSSRNNVTAPATVNARIRTVLWKAVTAVKIRLAHEAECLQGRVLHKFGTLLNTSHNAFRGSRSSKFPHTPTDHALAAVQHVYLMCALLAGQPTRFYRDFYLHIAHFYPLWISLPEPFKCPDPTQEPDSSFESASSGSKHSAPVSDDSFHTQDSE
ncbi:uncharacterized protein LOC144174778 [Haemaphysalis longicornis]